MTARRPTLSRLPPRASRLRDRDGFALLITLTLLAFIVLLLVGLAAYTRVETAAAGNTQRQAQARQNALFAFNVALGQLQKYAGPDQRATATAESVTGVNAMKRRYTGVWDATATTETAPLAWLVSGVESGATETINQAVPAARRVTLVGTRTDGTAGNNNVIVALQDITTVGVPGQSGVPTGVGPRPVLPPTGGGPGTITPSAAAAPVGTTIGRYGWWIGDQGVKAPVAINDRAVDTGSSAAAPTTVTYAPFDSIELRRRIRQQVALGAGPSNTNGTVVFEPRTSTGTNPNSTLAANTTVSNQLAFLKNSSGTAIGPATVRTNFHAWSPNNANVLVDTASGGLRRDLSLRPDLLGGAFAAWADYDGAAGGARYMEDPASPFAPEPLPAYDADPLRRRYTMGGANASGPPRPALHPVLSSCVLTFNIRTEPPSLTSQNGSQSVAQLQARARWAFGFWNPWTSAFVPENLRLEISGLPTNVQLINDTEGTKPAVFSLQDVFGNPTMKIDLSWNSVLGTDDAQSWLPGRVYSWVAAENKTPASDSYPSQFYSRDLGDSGEGVWRPIRSLPIDGDDQCRFDVAVPQTLKLDLYAVRAGGDELIATFTSPEFEAFTTTAYRLYQGTYQISYLFRLAEPIDGGAGGTWLTTAGHDLRDEVLPPTAFVPFDGDKGFRPEQYDGFATASYRDRLLDRVMGSTGRSYNEDVPVFELPRLPILSLGALQHLQVAGARPFAIGNPWGADVEINGVKAGALFDRFFFSGLAAPVTGALKPAANPDTPPEEAAAETAVLSQPALRPLPNPLLIPLPRKADGTTVTVGNLLGKVTSFSDSTEGFSAKHVLQTGAFNFNSVNATAWRAMLRATRFANNTNFSFLNANPSNGTANPSGETTLNIAAADAVFFRFPQSAQETFEVDQPVQLLDADGNSIVSTYAATNATTGTDPDPTSTANTHLFRRGMRALSATETATFATRIAARVTEKIKDSGPFRSLEEFLKPLALFGDRSLLEAAIEDAGLNASVAEFSSQWLTQADVITALAPVLFPRSDTFVIRTYGEAVNPVTSNVEGRAWCEAVVQRFPDYFDKTADGAEVAPGALTSELNKANGRRFKVLSFRWLTRSDI